jgi:hypothetical protein
MDTLTNPRAVIGGNEPPLAERLGLDHADLLKRATEAAGKVPEQAKADTEDQVAAYTEAAKGLKDLLSEADAAFTAAKAPWLAGGRAVDDFFRFRDTVKAAAARLVKAINTFQQAQLAARRKAEAEAAEKARREAIVMDEAPPPAAAPVIVKEAARIVTSSGSKASATVKWKGRVIDFDQVPRQYLVLNERALQAAIDGMRAQGKKLEDAKIPGVDVYEDIQTSIRR